MEDLKRLKKKRQGHRTYAKKICQKVDEELQTYNEENRGKIRTYRDVLNEKLGVLSDLDSTILNLKGEDDIEKEIEETSELRIEIQERVTNIELAISHNDSSSGESKSSVSSKNTEKSSKSGQSKGSGNNVKLPKLMIKKFQEKHSEYQTFWESFDAAVHSNESLSNIEKLNYLRSFLEGPASATIAGLSLTNENCKIAVDLLRDRYGNKQMIISSHMDSLLKIPRVTNANDKRVRVVYDQIETNVRCLQALGVNSEMYGSLLIPVLMEKIPEEYQLIISRKMKSDTWDITELMTVFREELEAREKTKFVGGANVSVAEKPLSKSSKSNEPITASALYTNDQAQVDCFLCNKPGHKSYKCNLVTDPDKRKEILMKKGRCFLCLRKGHMVRDCPSEMKCMKCSGRHHTIVCKRETEPVLNYVDQPRPSEPRVTVNPPRPSASATNLYINNQTSVLLQTAVADVTNTMSGKSIKARVIFDSGPQRSYVTNHMKRALQLPSVESANLMIKTFGSEKEQPKTCELVKLSVSKSGGLHLYMHAYVVPTICSPLSQQRIRFAKFSYEHLSSLMMADDCEGDVDMPIDILIGSDFYWQFMTGETRKGNNGGPVAIETHLGWVLSGPVHDPCKNPVESSTCLNGTHVLRLDTERMNEPCKLKEELKRFWEVEALGIKAEGEDMVHQQFLDKVRMKSGRYKVSLPWRELHPTLPDNYDLSFARLSSLIRRLRNKPDVLREYNNVIRDQEMKGIVETVTSTQMGDKVHYLPHREVIRADKQTTKLRVVFDASAKKEGPSLNDCLYAGPSLLPMLMDILIRFRCHRVALVADIEKAFLMIGVEKNDRDALRFLWIDDVNSDQPKVEIKRFTRLVFGVSSSLFLLNATLRYHMNQYAASDPEFVKKVTGALYIDDLTTGGQTVEETYQLYLKSKLRMSEAGFNLRKWSSNSKELIKRIREPNYSSEKVESHKVSEDDTAYSSTSWGVDLEVNDEREHKVLGITWNHETGELSVDLGHIVKTAASLPVTKRTVLKVTAGVYDPLGWISPVIVEMKVLFQKICEMKGDWDGELTSELKDTYDKWIMELRKVQEIKVKRCYFRSDLKPVSVQLHGFSDASSYAYAAAVYMRIEYPNGVKSVLVASKTRVAPLSGSTIPRLELLAAVILSRLIKHVESALSQTLKIDDLRCWVDSMAVLFWIIGEQKQWKQLVQNRVVNIRAKVSSSRWSYCHTTLNPADLPSRGVKATELERNEKWWSGTEFLKLPEDQWPVKPKESSLEEGVLREMKKESKKEVVVTTSNLSVASNVCMANCLRQEQFSTSKKLFRVTAYVMRFISRLKNRMNISNKEPAQSAEKLTIEELETAEIMWLREAQKPMVANDKFGQVKNSLRLFVDNMGVYRCKGRLENSTLPYETKFPVLLPQKSHLTTLIVQECHEKVMHRGVKDTLTEIRSRYWISKGRQVVKRVLRNCTKCAKFQGKVYGPTNAAVLPEFRVEKGFAFANTGVDFAGPLYAKNVYGGERKMYKVYIALFTCASSRAVHLDLVPTLDAQSLIRCLKRFFARRGVNQLFVSDNAKTFKSRGVQQFVLQKGISWRFNMPRAPWWGGFFERMVRCTKSSLKKTLGGARLTYEELLTVLIDVEAVLNSRPLTYVYDDEIEEVLTPSHLMIGRRLLSSETRMDKTMQRDDTMDVNKRAKFLKLLPGHFWNRWQKEYLTNMLPGK